MNDDRELKTTYTFLISSVVLAGIAAVVGWASRPPSPEEFSDIGEPFYADFTDPAEATRLRLASWNEDQAKVDVFEVKFTPESGWTIPSHNDYPADGEEQLSKTAASVIGIERGGLMPGRKESHPRYGVVDPLDESAGTDGRGSRLTLWKGDTVLADYVIGDRVDESSDAPSGGEALYYVRKSGEDGEERVYRANLDIDISTDFADWIEPDLLELGSVSDLRRMVVDRYQVDEQTGRVVEGDKSTVSRASATDNWKLEGLNEETESLVTGTVSKMSTSLDDLEIIGVRKKPAILTAQLKREEARGFNQLDVLQMQADLESKGFFLDPSGILLSNEGDFSAGTDEGTLYTLRFGEVFSGSKASLEAGGEPAGENTKGDETKEDSAEKEEGEDSSEESTGEDDSTLRGRYVFITVAFDESLMSPPPQPPIKPEPPAETQDAAEADDTDAAKDAEPEEDGDAEASDDSSADENKSDENNSDESEAEKTEETDVEEAEEMDPEYKLALETYETQLEQYERDKKAYDERVADGKKRVEELTNRFADWYYVITAETFDDLAVSRSDLVEPKEAPELPETTTSEAGTDAPAGDAKPAMKDDKKPEGGKGDEKTSNGKVEPVMESLRPDAGKRQKEADAKARAEDGAKKAESSETPAAEEAKPDSSEPGETSPGGSKDAGEEKAETPES